MINYLVGNLATDQVTAEYGASIRTYIVPIDMAMQQ